MASSLHKRMDFGSAGGGTAEVEECPSEVLRICGAWGSPYTQKMIAVCRYRRIPYRFLVGAARQRLAQELPKPPVQLAPTFYFGSEPMVDSTPIIKRLEGMTEAYPQSSGRSLVHPHGGMAFLADLIEDFGDEFLTKCMYHYRWEPPPDAQKAGEFLMLSGNPAVPAEELAQLSQFVRARQTGRLDFVGSNLVTKAAIEGTFVRVVQLLDAHLAAGHVFLLGGRPSTADFGLFGQLTQLHRVENTSRVVLEGQSLRVAAWISLMTDLSGWPVSAQHWLSAGEPLPPTLRALLSEVGRLYAPFMLANARAVSAKQERMEAELGPDRVPWAQPAYSYAAKCLQRLQEAYRRLAPVDRAFVDSALAGTGCAELFPPAASAVRSRL